MAAEQIFISYKSEYLDFAQRLRDHLRSWGFRTWLDRDDIPEGAYFRHEIQRGLETSAFVIGVLTPEALSSREVMWEWDYALEKSRFVPVKFRECNLPYHLQGTQYVDFTADESRALNQLRDALASSPPIPILPVLAPVKAAQIVPKSKTLETNRSRMLAKVHDFWIVGVLENALKESGAFDVGLDTAPGAVLHHTDYGDYHLPSSTKIGDIFRDMNRELLILGAPGAGKTILLLQLARELIERARADATQPIPVVFNLSSWAGERKPLAEWIVDELRLKYQVPQRTSKEWVEREQILPLLDGLDEVAEAHRNACVEAINTFRSAYRSVDLAVCSRIADYELLTSKLDLQGAIMLQALSSAQIERYLNRSELTGLREVTVNDPLLSKMAGTPFLLNTMAYAYRDIPAPALRLPTDQSRQMHLFALYTEKRLKSAPTSPYTPKQTRHYLSWLARNMVAQKKTVFYIEDMDWSWTVGRWERYLYRPGGILISAFIGCIIGVLIGGFAGRIADVQLVGLFFGLISGCIIGTIFGWFLTRSESIDNAETLSWQIRWQTVVGGVFAGLIVGLLTASIGAIFTDDYVSLIGGIELGFCSFTGVVIGAGLHKSERTVTRIYPNMGTFQSYNHAFALGTIMGILSGLATAVGLFVIILITVLSRGSLQYGLANAMNRLMENGTLELALTVSGFGLGVGIFTGIIFGGGEAVIKHVFLRQMFIRTGDTPWNYARFLDYAASIGILRKVGGGYIFVHRLLLEYFADQQAAK